MKPFKLTAIFAATALGIIACTTPQTTPPLGDNSINPNSNVANSGSPVAPASPNNTEFAAAKEIYDKKCVKCHLETGEGGKVEIDTVALKVPNFRDPRNQDDDPSDYIEKVERGASGKMPAFKGKLTDEEIKSVVDYIRHQYQGK